jgi:hypothetical protein
MSALDAALRTAHKSAVTKTLWAALDAALRTAHKSTL